jgi:hypothetical protein
VGPRAGLGVMEKRKISCPYQESNLDSLVIQPHSLVTIPTSCFPGVKRQGHEADHSLPSSVKVKNRGAIPPFPYIYSQHEFLQC